MPGSQYGNVDEKFRNIIKVARAGIFEQIIQAQEAVFGATTRMDWFRKAIAKLEVKAGYGSSFGHGDYFRSVLHILRTRSDDDQMAEAVIEEIVPCLRNNLIFEGTKIEDVDEGRWTDSFFLCAEIADENLPWDMTEKEW